MHILCMEKGTQDGCLFLYDNFKNAVYLFKLFAFDMDSISTIFLAASLIIIMLGMGLSLTIEDFSRIFKYPRAILVGFANQLVLLPVIGFALANAFPLSPEIAIGIMILAPCPGGPTSNLITHLAKGDTALG